jgi:hypothetical protein
MLSVALAGCGGSSGNPAAPAPPVYSLSFSPDTAPIDKSLSLQITGRHEGRSDTAVLAVYVKGVSCVTALTGRLDWNATVADYHDWSPGDFFEAAGGNVIYDVTPTGGLTVTAPTGTCISGNGTIMYIIFERRQSATQGTDQIRPTGHFTYGDCNIWNPSFPDCLKQPTFYGGKLTVTQ